MLVCFDLVTVPGRSPLGSLRSNPCLPAWSSGRSGRGTLSVTTAQWMSQIQDPGSNPPWSFTLHLCFYGKAKKSALQTCIDNGAWTREYTQNLPLQNCLVSQFYMFSVWHFSSILASHFYCHKRVFCYCLGWTWVICIYYTLYQCNYISKSRWFLIAQHLKTMFKHLCCMTSYKYFPFYPVTENYIFILFFWKFHS